MEQEIRFTTTPDGVNICYATVGQGPPLVKAPNWLTHLEYDWHSPIWRHWWEELAKDHLLVRFDQRGCGLSDWAVEDLSFAARVVDLECVVDALGLDQFALLGISMGGPTALEYTARHTERVSHLVLYGTYAGRGAEQRSAEEIEEWEALITLMRQGWGRDDPSYRQIFASRFIPGATAEQMGWFNDLARVSASPENAARTSLETGKIDVTDRLPRITVPTLVLHSRDEINVPFERGRQLAAKITDARFVPLESKNHLLLETEPAWQVFLSEVRRFLGTERDDGSDLPAHPKVPEEAGAHTVIQASDELAEEARSLITKLDSVPLSRYSVVAGYARYDEATRNVLNNARQHIAEAFERSTPKRENHLFWAAPGSGKTYFVQRVGESLSADVRYRELNLAGLGQEEFLSGLRELDGGTNPCLCLVDEIDAKPDEVWPYEVLLPYLDAAVDGRARLVFVFAGSSGSSVAEMKQRIAARPKGTDLLSRIPDTNVYEIPSMSIGDRILVALTQFRQAGKEVGKEIRAVEKLGLYYVALNPRLKNARQLRESAVRAIERMPPGEDRVKYDHLFSPGDSENKEFWMRATGFAPHLVDTFATLED